jgi:hypothetical protein
MVTMAWLGEQREAFPENCSDQSTLLISDERMDMQGRNWVKKNRPLWYFPNTA